MQLGVVSEIWRYPVKSLAGESLQQASIHTMGLCGDRAWALIDEATGDIIGAKRHPRLLEVNACYISNYSNSNCLYGDAVPSANIIFQDGQSSNSRSADAAARLSEITGKSIYLAPLEPPQNRQHYRLSTPPMYGRFFSHNEYSARLLPPLVVKLSISLVRVHLIKISN